MSQSYLINHLSYNKW